MAPLAKTASTVLALALAAGAFYYLAVGRGVSSPAPRQLPDQGGAPVAAATSAKPVAKSSGAPAPKASGFTLAQVAAHGSAGSCWTAINGQVYDLTSWIAEHPGGEGAILSICGKDGSDAFNGQHGGQGRPEAMLASFLIGPLAA